MTVQVVDRSQHMFRRRATIERLDHAEQIADGDIDKSAAFAFGDAEHNPPDLIVKSGGKPPALMRQAPAIDAIRRIGVDFDRKDMSRA